MSIHRRFQDHAFPSLVTTTTEGRLTIFASDEAAGLLVKVLYEVRTETELQILAFVVMSDHVHLVLRPAGSASMARIIQLIKGRFARRYNLMTGNSGPLWQSRYHEAALRKESELRSAIEYVHSNPVPARLAAAPSAFAWSSADGRYPVDLDQYLSQAEA